MSTNEIRLTSENQKFHISLGGVDYTFFIRWNARAGLWILNIGDSNEMPLLNGIPLVVGVNLLAGHKAFNVGGIGGNLFIKSIEQADDLFGLEQNPSFFDLGENTKLYFGKPIFDESLLLLEEAEPAEPEVPPAETMTSGATYWADAAMMSCWGGSPQDPVYDWNFNHPNDSPKGTFSVMLQMVNYPVGPINGSIGLIRTSTTNSNWATGALPNLLEFVIAIAPDYSIFIYLHGVAVYRSGPNIILIDGTWQHLLVTWDLTNGGNVLTTNTVLNVVRVWINGTQHDNIRVTPAGTTVPSMVYYSHEGFVMLHSSANSIPQLTINYSGCTNNLWWCPGEVIADPSVFINDSGTPLDLGSRGQRPTGSPPWMYLHWDPSMSNPGDWLPASIPGVGSGYTPVTPPWGYYGLNRAGYKPDDSAYWIAAQPGAIPANAAQFCDPNHPNLSQTGLRPTICSTPWEEVE